MREEKEKERNIEKQRGRIRKWKIGIKIKESIKIYCTVFGLKEKQRK